MLATTSMTREKILEILVLGILSYISYHRRGSSTLHYSFGDISSGMAPFFAVSQSINDLKATLRLGKHFLSRFTVQLHVLT